MKKYSLGITICVVAFLIGCASYLFITQFRNNKKLELPKVKVQENKEQEKQLPQKLDENSARKLCNRLSEMKHLPYKPEDEIDIYDEVYDELIKAGDAVIPCLIDKITDTTEMQDPRGTKVLAGGFTVGDLAYFMFIGITKNEFTEFLPDKVKERFKTEGVYAFHAFTSYKKNRINLQKKLDDWYCENFAPWESSERLIENYKEADLVIYVKTSDAKFLSDPEYQDIVFNLLEGEVIESFKDNIRKGTHIAFSVQATKKTSLESYKSETIYFFKKFFDEEERKWKFTTVEFAASLNGERNIEKMRRIKARFNRKSKI